MFKMPNHNTKGSDNEELLPPMTEPSSHSFALTELPANPPESPINTNEDVNGDNEFSLSLAVEIFAPEPRPTSYWGPIKTCGCDPLDYSKPVSASPCGCKPCAYLSCCQKKRMHIESLKAWILSS